MSEAMVIFRSTAPLPTDKRVRSELVTRQIYVQWTSFALRDVNSLALDGEDDDEDVRWT